MPRKDRWRCTLAMCDRVPDIFTRSLDECCEHFGIKGRKKNKAQDAVEDCTLTAQVYMKLMEIPPMKMGKLGFDF